MSKIIIIIILKLKNLEDFKVLINIDFFILLKIIIKIRNIIL